MAKSESADRHVTLATSLASRPASQHLAAAAVTAMQPLHAVLVAQPQVAAHAELLPLHAALAELFLQDVALVAHTLDAALAEPFLQDVALAAHLQDAAHVELFLQDAALAEAQLLVVLQADAALLLQPVLFQQQRLQQSLLMLQHHQQKTLQLHQQLKKQHQPQLKPLQKLHQPLKPNSDRPLLAVWLCKLQSNIEFDGGGRDATFFHALFRGISKHALNDARLSLITMNAFLTSHCDRKSIHVAFNSI